MHSTTTQSPNGPTTSVGSTTVVHDDFLLVDSAGKQHPFQLSNFDAAVYPGQSVTVAWAIQRGKQRGPYVIVGNHSTGRLYFNDKVLKELFTPFYIRPSCCSLLFPVMLPLVLLSRSYTVVQKVRVTLSCAVVVGLMIKLLS